MEDWKLDKNFSVGDRVEARDGSFRGNIVSINVDAEKWPYEVRDAAGVGAGKLFSASELRKTDLFISPVSVTDTLAQLDVLIAAKQSELSTLMMSRRVLEQVEDHG
jgi:hypothetical protein